MDRRPLTAHGKDEEMQQDTPAGFVERFSEVAADSNYSRYIRLRETGTHDIRAAATALREHTADRWGETGLSSLHQNLDEELVTEALLAQRRHYDDESELVAAEFQEFWDACDVQRLSHGTLERIKTELARSFLASRKAEKFTVVDNEQGIWLFKFKEQQ